MERNLRNIALLTSDDLATYGELQGMYGRGIETRKIPLDKIAVRENFNSRINFGDIRLLADFIKEGGAIPPIDVDILKADGTAIITDGERRYRAYLLLKQEGFEGVEFMQCFVNPRNLTEADRKCKQASKNNNKDFEPMELAELFHDLRTTYGMSNAEIAKKTGHNAMHVSNQLRLSGITDEEKELIREGAVSATAVLDMLKADVTPSARLDAIKSASESSGSSEGGKKGKLKIADVPIMGDLDHVPLDISKDTPETIFKQVFIYITALNRMIGMNSKMSDVTFKLENELRNLKKYMQLNGSFGVPEKTIEDNSVPGALDPLFAEAAKLVVDHQMASQSLLQRKLKLGYNRASRIMDQLQANQVIGEFKGSEPRSILVADEESLQALLLTLVMAQEEDKTTYVPYDIDQDDDQPF